MLSFLQVTRVFKSGTWASAGVLMEFSNVHRTIETLSCKVASNSINKSKKTQVVPVWI